MKEKLRAIIGMLIAIFIFGMAENLLGTPGSDQSTVHNIFSGIILILHILTAIGILVTAVLLIRRAKDASRPQAARLGRGLGAASLAFIAGIATMALSSPWGDIASFIMAIGFIAALVFYGLALVHSSESS